MDCLCSRNGILELSLDMDYFRGHCTSCEYFLVFGFWLLTRIQALDLWGDGPTLFTLLTNLHELWTVSDYHTLTIIYNLR